jgi:2-polyprenyl-6-methoxyphenol hydroxylase-like FAD-dependent oxidoreductase
MVVASGAQASGHTEPGLQAGWQFLCRLPVAGEKMVAKVLIVGAGPVGLTMAAELARYGVPVRVVEKAAQRTDKSKALVLWSRTLELLDRSGCSAALVAAGHQVTGANIIAGDKTIGHVGLSGVASPYPSALMLPQSETERLLEARLAHFGIAVERGVEAIGFTQTQTGVTTILRQPDCAEEKVETDWLIGCDGAHSTVRHGLGLSFQGDTLQSDWILADVHISGFKIPDTEMAIYWHADGTFVTFPISPGRYRVIADVGVAKGAHPTDPTLAEVQAVADRRGPGGLKLSDPIWLSGFRINERKVEDYRSGRVFVAGDAAHVHSPAGGQGMNTGMQDAINLAWKLALASRSTRVPEALLDSYSAERSAVGEQILKQAGRLTAIGVMHGHTAQMLRNFAGGLLLGLSPVRRAMADTLTEITIGYPQSPLNGPHVVGHPAPGERAPPVAGQPPVGAGDRPRFALFAAPGATTDQLIADHADLLEAAPRPTLAAGGVWLVRPDGYVAASARAGDEGSLGKYLDGIVGSG